MTFSLDDKYTREEGTILLTGIQAPVGWDGKTLPQARRALGKAGDIGGDARAQQVYLLAPWNESLMYTASLLTNADSPTVGRLL